MSESILGLPFLDFVLPIWCWDYIALDLDGLGILFLDNGLLCR